LQQHLATLNADFVGLTGTKAELESVYAAYGIFHEKASMGAKGKGYLVNHNTSAFVIDPEGVWRLRHSAITPSEDILHDVRQLLKRTRQ
jgi:cytochrome oxidase Cu insertion factor (SCO1/SenC/PrrC family)